MSRINWVCDDCYFNMGNYCSNDDYSHNYNNCQNCNGYEENEDPEAHEAYEEDLYQDPEDNW